MNRFPILTQEYSQKKEKRKGNSNKNSKNRSKKKCSHKSSNERSYEYQEESKPNNVSTSQNPVKLSSKERICFELNFKDRKVKYDFKNVFPFHNELSQRNSSKNSVKN